MTEHEKAVAVIKMFMAMADEGSPGHDAYSYALKAMEKQNPVPVKIHNDKWVSDNRHLITCPMCEEWLDYEDWMFCPKCGQAVKWND